MSSRSLAPGLAALALALGACASTADEQTTAGASGRCGILQVEGDATCEDARDREWEERTREEMQRGFEDRDPSTRP